MADINQLTPEQARAELNRRQKEKLGNFAGGLSDIVAGFSRGLAGQPVAQAKGGGSGMNTIRDILIANALDPTKKVGQMKIDEVNRKLQEQQDGVPQQDVPLGIPEANVDTNTPSQQTPLSVGQTQDEAPPQFIKVSKGKNDFGIEEFETKPNKEYDAWLKRQELGTKGLPAETAGKASMLEQAKQDLLAIEPILFPGEGEEERFSRGTAFAANIPMSKLPVIGRVIPDSLPGHTRARKVNSAMNNALEAKLRIETGAAATQDEFNRLMERFGISGADTAASAKDKWKRLMEFMENASVKIDPQGNYQYYEKGGEYDEYLKTIGE